MKFELQRAVTKKLTNKLPHIKVSSKNRHFAYKLHNDKELRKKSGAVIKHESEKVI